MQILSRSTFNTSQPTVSETEGAFVLVDKPYGRTSFSIVHQIRRDAPRRSDGLRHKVGHAGTLDPLATGLLIVAIGRATKSIDTFMHLDKVYEVEMRLGITSPSFDLETPIQIVSNPQSISTVDVES